METIQSGPILVKIEGEMERKMRKLKESRERAKAHIDFINKYINSETYYNGKVLKAYFNYLHPEIHHLYPPAEVLRA